MLNSESFLFSFKPVSYFLVEICKIKVNNYENQAFCHLNIQPDFILVQ